MPYPSLQISSVIRENGGGFFCVCVLPVGATRVMVPDQMILSWNWNLRSVAGRDRSLSYGPAEMACKICGTTFKYGSCFKRSDFNGYTMQ